MPDIWSELRPQLEHLTSPLPLAALQLAEARRDDIAPQLVAELEAIAANPAAAQEDGYVLHLYAMLFLAPGVTTAPTARWPNSATWTKPPSTASSASWSTTATAAPLHPAATATWPPSRGWPTTTAPAAGPAPRPSKASASPPSKGAPPAAR